MPKRMNSALLASLLLLIFLSGCALGPDYQRPEALVPVQYKSDAPWKEATPSDHISKGSWWEIYKDPTLNTLETQITQKSLTLEAAFARLNQVRAAAGISRSERMPQIDLGADAQRGRTAAEFSTTGTGQISNSFQVPMTLGYEIDLWGRVQRSIEAAEADVESATADYQNLLLLLQAGLARNYFTLRAVDADIALLDKTAELRNDALELIRSRYKYGQVGQLDLERARSELFATRAESIGQQKIRDELENAIALLIGVAPSSFNLAAHEATAEDNPVPQLRPGLPSSLLERRPDISAAERQMAASSARIGVAKTAFFPAISLTGSAGFSSSQADTLFNWDSRTWGLGPAISLPIFDGGRNQAGLERARAVYEEAVANYRQQVLVAFAEVEDGLNGLQALAHQRKDLQAAADAAILAWQISEKRYNAGLVSYLEVVDSQRTALQSKRQLVQNRNQQLGTSVQLIKALGGSWQEEG